MGKRKSWGGFGLLAASLMLSACGGSDGGFSDKDNGGGTPGPEPVNAAGIRLIAGSAVLPSNADSVEEGIELTAIAVDASNRTVAGATISFSSSSGVIVVSETTTGADGTLKATLHTGGDPNPRTIVVTARSGDRSQSINVQVLTQSGGNSQVTAVGLITSSSQLPSSASTGGATGAVTVTAFVRDGNNVGVSGQTVIFAATSGQLVMVEGTTDDDGIATAVLTTGGDPTLRTITVTANANGRASSAQVQVVAPSGGGPPVAGISLTTSRAQLLSNASSPGDPGAVTLTALVRDASNNGVPNVSVRFTADSGFIEGAEDRMTDANGRATAVLTTGGVATLRTITVTASAGGQSTAIQVNVVDPSSGGPVVGSLSLVFPDGNTLSADADAIDEGLAVVAVARNANNIALPGVSISFDASSGEIAVVTAGGTTTTTAVTDATGRANAVLTTAGNRTLRPITVTVTASGTQTSAVVQVVAPPMVPNDPLPRLGVVQNGIFTPGAIAIGQSPLSAGGSSGLQVDVIDTANGNVFFTDPVNVSFSSPCIANSLARVDPNPVPSIDGTVTATYVALGCSGSDQITARAVINGVAQTAQGTIQVTAGNLGSIEFVSATPRSVGIRGSGQPETSAVVFRVRNDSGGPVAGQLVTFSLNTDVGGISVAPLMGTTNNQGVVQTVVISGTVATAVRVTATATQGDVTIRSQSELLVVSTNIPDQASFSVSVGTFNIEGLTIDNQMTNVTLLAADRFNNPVPLGTAISFTTEGGAVAPSCTTGTNAPPGECSVMFRSQNPRPGSFVAFLPLRPEDGDIDVDGIPGPDDIGQDKYANGPRAGRSTVLVSAIGEESFLDLDGDGRFDDPEPFGDLGEAFRDDNEDGIFQLPGSVEAPGSLPYPGEEFLDFGGARGVRDSGNSLFTGVLCDGPSLCDPVRTLNVRDSQVIILSGSQPRFELGAFVPVGSGIGLRRIPRDLSFSNASFDGGDFSIVQDQAAVIRFTIRDVNFQPMPAGTIIRLSASGDAGSVLGTSSFTVPSQTDDSIGGNVYGFTFKAAKEDPMMAADKFGTLELSVTSPNGLTTFFSFGVVSKAKEFVELGASPPIAATATPATVSWVSAKVQSCFATATNGSGTRIAVEGWDTNPGSMNGTPMNSTGQQILPLDDIPAAQDVTLLLSCRTTITGNEERSSSTTVRR